MKELVLITGASSGIGYEMARELASRKFDLVVVARREAPLRVLKAELESRFGVNVYPFVRDLSVTGQAIGLYREVKELGLEVTMLVNNAGVGGYGPFSETSLEAELGMIALNVSSVVVLTKLFVQDMKKRDSGKIMNMASILSFLPFPYYSVYSATKAFILFFTETLREELEGTGITVTALAPGPTDTSFNTAEMWKTNAYKTNKPVDPKRVAQQGVQYLLTGKGTKIVGFNNWVIANTPRFTPRRLILRITKHLASPRLPLTN